MPKLVAVLVAFTAASTAAAQQQSPTTFHQLGHAILRELIETNTTGSSGNTTTAAEQLATRFKDAGFAESDIQIVGPTVKNRNLVVRYRGTGAQKPILLLAHIDVVEAKREDWTYDPFVLTERDGYFYGRGTQDQKGGAAALVTTLLRLRAEKVFHSVVLTVKNPGGHSSRPRKDNAIYTLAAALARLEKFEFPAKPNQIVRLPSANPSAFRLPSPRTCEKWPLEPPTRRRFVV